MRISIILSLLLAFISANAQKNSPTLIPYPNKVELIESAKPLAITPDTKVITNLPSNSLCNALLRQIIKERLGVDLDAKGKQANTKGKKSGSSIRMTIDPLIEGSEHYRLEVSDSVLTISGATDAAIFYGLQTLDQLLMGDAVHSAAATIAPVRIDDAPRFGYRALMLDPARNFLPIDDVKFFIDQMARYKYNVLQLHLTDDQGWRMEIKSHPQLTQIGAFRNHNEKTGAPDNGFYTQAELKDLIEYAAQRHVEIVPELDVPGHTVAVLAAYPELGCTHTDTIAKEIGSTVNLMLCANNEKVYEIYDDIIRETASVFPSKRIHLGGDEAVIEQNWTKCEHCKALMKDLGYSKAAQLMNYFFKHILASVEKYGKEPILWCELDNIYLPAEEYLFDYPKNATLVTWRNGLTPLCIELTRQHGNALIMAPGEYAYLDYPQYKGDLPEFDNWGMPVTTLEKCYTLDPGYGLPVDKQAHITGVMGTLWGEAIKDINRATYMAFPRALALAEAGWTQMENRDWESFKQRLYPNLTDLMKHGVSVRAPFEIARQAAK